MNLKNLFKYIRFNSSSDNNVQEILSLYDEDDYKKYIEIDKNKKYTKKLIYRNESFEIFIITWNIDVQSNIHDHSENGCFLKLLEGSLTENRYGVKTKELFSSKCIEKNEITYIDNNIGLHDIINNNKNNISVSIHVYSPINHITKYY
jgi:cysteine dioxygenase